MLPDRPYLYVPPSLIPARTRTDPYVYSSFHHLYLPRAITATTSSTAGRRSPHGRAAWYPASSGGSWRHDFYADVLNRDAFRTGVYVNDHAALLPIEDNESWQRPMVGLWAVPTQHDEERLSDAVDEEMRAGVMAGIRMQPPPSLFMSAMLADRLVSPELELQTGVGPRYMRRPAASILADTRRRAHSWETAIETLWNKEANDGE